MKLGEARGSYVKLGELGELYEARRSLVILDEAR